MRTITIQQLAIPSTSGGNMGEERTTTRRGEKAVQLAQPNAGVRRTHAQLEAASKTDDLDAGGSSSLFLLHHPGGDREKGRAIGQDPRARKAGQLSSPSEANRLDTL